MINVFGFKTNILSAIFQDIEYLRIFSISVCQWEYGFSPRLWDWPSAIYSPFTWNHSLNFHSQDPKTNWSLAGSIDPVTPDYQKEDICGLKFMPSQNTLQLLKYITVSGCQVRGLRRMNDWMDSEVLQKCDRFPDSVLGGVIQLQHQLQGEFGRSNIRGSKSSYLRHYLM
jgi:hypothetical protein